MAPEHAASAVRATSLDAGGSVVDSTLELAELVTACVSDHQPGHTQQLESYRPAEG